MVSNALSTRRRYLRRPKVCKASPNPGRCHVPEPPPVVYPPHTIFGFLELSGKDACTGPNHHFDFIASPEDPDAEPVVYRAETPGYSPGTWIVFYLVTEMYTYWEISLKYSHPVTAVCFIAAGSSDEFDWSDEQPFVLDEWVPITSGGSAHIEFTWEFP